MQTVRKKRRGEHPRLRWLLLAAVLLLAAAAFWLWHQENTAQPADTPAPTPANGTLARHDAGEIASLTVTLRGGETWSAEADGFGGLTVTADGATFPADPAMASTVLTAAAVIGYNRVLAEDLSALDARPDEFGLETPRLTAAIRYTDGTGITLRVGSRSAGDEEPFYYMTAEGDPRLYAMDLGTVEDLSVEASLLRDVPRLAIQQARIDRIEIADADGRRVWALDGAVTDSDAADRWFLTEPLRYPADGETLANMRKNISSLRLGAYVAPDTAENRALYGFDEPRVTLTVHLAAAQTVGVGPDGAAQPEAHGEETVTLVVGGAKSDMVDYALFDGQICTVSRFLVDAFALVGAMDTVTRYPVLTTLSNLSSLEVTAPGAHRVWTVSRAERVAANNSLVTDANGSTVWDETVTLNGEPFAWDAFSALYERLLMVTVSGRLPEGWTAAEEPHTVYVFRTVTGTEHTIALTAFDAMHDAVTVDGSALFYLIRGGLDVFEQH